MRDEIKTEAEFLRSAALDIVTLEPLEDSARAEVYAIDARRIAAKLEALEARAEKAEAERDAENYGKEGLVGQIAELRRERDALRDREKHFASVLSVADRGQYRNDWDAAIRRVVAERDALREAVEKAEAALADIAEGEPDPNDLAEKIWCKERADEGLRIVRAALNREPDT